MKIAIALFGTRVSPRFDCAPKLRVVEVDNAEILTAHEVSVENWDAGKRIKKLAELGVNSFICGGIDGFSMHQLNSLGIIVYSWVTGEAEEALSCLLKGQLKSGFIIGPGGRCCGRWRFGHRRKMEDNRR